MVAELPLDCRRSRLEKLDKWLDMSGISDGWLMLGLRNGIPQ